MDKPDLEAEPYFSRPIRQILLMLLVLGLTGFGAFVALPRVLPVFQANPYLNGFILFVFAIGVIACFWQTFQLIGCVRWIDGFIRQYPGHDSISPPSLLTPLANLLRQRGKRMKIASGSARSILDSVAQRIDEAREITRYIVSMLIFLGLLGTFYGLATTVPAVVDTIRSLAPQEGEAGLAVFNRLMTGLEAQLGGMGVAFASSLLGLAGSLVVGLLELFAGHGQNRFYRELEEWMSTITRVGFASGDGDAGGEGSMMAAVVDGIGEQMEGLQMVLAETEANRAALDEKIGRLVTAMEQLSMQGTGSSVDASTFMRIAEGQERLITYLESRGDGGGDGIDAESRMRLRSIDVQMLRILEEISAGRQESVSELRAELSDLARAMREGATKPPRTRPQGGSLQTQLRRIKHDKEQGG
ncbi:MAG: biopolymer transporter ExbB [Pseudomonadota bacterium]